MTLLEQIKAELTSKEPWIADHRTYDTRMRCYQIDLNYVIGVIEKYLKDGSNLYEVGYENGRREEHDRVLKILQEHFKGV